MSASSRPAWTRSCPSATSCSRAVSSARWSSRTASAAWCRACCRTPSATPARAIGPAGSSTRSIPAPRRGRAARCRRCCAAATTPRSPRGARVRVWRGPCSSGRSSFGKHHPHRTSSACSIRSGATAAARSSEPPVCRAATEDDLPAILAIAQQARNYLRRHRVDQWQGVYPNEETFRADIAAGTCHVLTYQGRCRRHVHAQPHAGARLRCAHGRRWRSTVTMLPTLVPQRRCSRLARHGMADHHAGGGTLAREAARARCRHAPAQRRTEKASERHGRFCGNILCDEPGHDPRRQAFELL